MDNQSQEITAQINDLKYKATQYIYMILVFAVSFAVMTILPLLNVGNDTPGMDLPTTTAAWIYFITLRAIISFINVFIYIMFIRQGKQNSFNHPNYIQANKLLGTTKIKINIPRSPTKFTSLQYGGKSVGILFGTLVALIALPPIVAYDWKMAATYAFTIIMDIVFGIYQMKVTEAYWQEEYLRWVEFIINQPKEAENVQKEVNNECLNEMA